MVIYGQFWCPGDCGQNWAQVGPTWPPPFGLIGLGQKRPNWPMDHGLQTVGRGLRPMGHRGRRGPKWPKKAIYALDPLIKGVGPKMMVMARGSRTP
ncbi:hypothetical protein O181_132601 [Austropuccinia psidii MF-1]|uniref:Uncharacterized protein n=1 Tax=Austropuccinia psidii MF-1 TaxID=1389203 RepID=A0A9Q3L6N6_9BASI|nr:hypothetical protein [Austropuccinia psidii MF-1]